ncbi:MAG: hypothetical protein QW393_04980 [Candidatus Micrarchaeaceae archaeon]
MGLNTARHVYQYMKEIYQVYSYIDVKGKTILDVGADFGLSPMHFINQGASRVIAFSLEKQKPWLAHPRIEWHRQKWDGDWHVCGVLKIDCEGCEYGRPVEWYLNGFKEFYIAIHKIKPEQYSHFNYYKSRLSEVAKLVYVSKDGLEEVYVRGGK